MELENEIFEDYVVNQNEKLDIYRYTFEKIIKDAFSKFFEGSKYTVKKNIRTYFYDAYTKNLYNDRDQINIMYVELKNYIPNNKIILEPNYTLEMIKKEIFNILISMSDKDTLLWKSKYAINLTYFIRGVDENNSTSIDESEKQEQKKTPNNDKLKHNSEIINFKVIFGLNCKVNGNYGIRYYAKNGGSEKLKFPLICLENYMYKNHITKNNYMYYANFIKKIVAEAKNHKKTDLAYNEIIETMLYNLPNNLFKNKPNKIDLRNIINYMKNFPLQDYLTIDNLEKLFLSQYYDYSILEGKEIIKILESYYRNMFA